VLLMMLDIRASETLVSEP